jgi:hypothetical protein
VLNSATTRGDVAQLGEHRVRIAGVRGSSPLISTTYRPLDARAQRFRAPPQGRQSASGRASLFARREGSALRGCKPLTGTLPACNRSPLRTRGPRPRWRRGVANGAAGGTTSSRATGRRSAGSACSLGATTRVSSCAAGRSARPAASSSVTRRTTIRSSAARCAGPTSCAAPRHLTAGWAGATPDVPSHRRRGGPTLDPCGSSSSA